MKSEKNILSDLTIKINAEELDEAIKRLKYANQLAKELNNGIALLQENTEKVNDECFYTVEDVIRLTGYSRPTVLGMFNMRDFPTCSVGKRKLVKKSAFWRFFDKPVVGDFEL